MRDRAVAGEIWRQEDLLQVSKVTKADGKPDVVEAVMPPNELANLFRVVTDVQHRILGKDQTKRSAGEVDLNGLTARIAVTASRQRSERTLTRNTSNARSVGRDLSQGNPAQGGNLVWSCTCAL